MQLYLYSLSVDINIITSLLENYTLITLYVSTGIYITVIMYHITFRTCRNHESRYYLRRKLLDVDNYINTILYVYCYVWIRYFHNNILYVLSDQIVSE